MFLDLEKAISDSESLNYDNFLNVFFSCFSSRTSFVVIFSAASVIGHFAVDAATKVKNLTELDLKRMILHGGRGGFKEEANAYLNQGRN
jgi:hypothetical protein